MEGESNHTLEHVLAILRENADELRGKGVRHAAVFGFVARGEAGPDSDVDIMVDVDHDVVESLLDHASIAGLIEEVLGREIDIAMRDRLKDHVKPSALREAVDAF